MPSSDGELALRNGFRRVIGAFRVNVRLEFAKERVHVQFVENDHVIHVGKRCHQSGAGALRQNRAPFAFQLSRAGIGVDSNNEDITFGPRRFQIAHVSDVEQIEHAVGKYNFASRAAMFFQHIVQPIARKNF